MENIESVVSYWDERKQKEANPVFDAIGSYFKRSLLASDIVWSIRRAKSKGKEVTAENVFEEIRVYEEKERPWGIFMFGDKFQIFRKGIEYYKDWEKLTYLERMEIQEYRQNRYLKQASI